jgi:uncharacterized protein (DUF2345 family)
MTDVTGSVSVNNSGGDQFNTNEERKTTPRAVNFDKDARSMEGAGAYPNYWSHKTRSGHTFIMDDSEGKETVTLQHRSGTGIQMRPDGGMLLTTHNGKYEVTFGENRVTISGAQDITVKGDASMRVYGNHNVTVHKDYNLTVLGDMNVTAKNMNRSIRGNMDTTAKNINKRVEGSSTYNTMGAHSVVSEGNMMVASRTQKAFFAGGKGIHASVTDQGDMTFKNEKGNMHMETKEGKFDAKFSDGTNEVTLLAKDGALHAQAAKAVNVESKQDKIQVKAKKDVGITATSGGVNVDAQSGGINMAATQNIVTKSTGGDVQIRSQGGNAQVLAGGQASIEGAGSTHVGQNQSTTNIVGGGSGVNVDALGGLLNLAGGLGLPFTGQIQQLSFIFDQIQSATGIPSISASKAQQPQEEPDASSEINSWK